MSVTSMSALIAGEENSAGTMQQEIMRSVDDRLDQFPNSRFDHDG